MQTGQGFAGINGQRRAHGGLHNADFVTVGGKALGRRHIFFQCGLKVFNEIVNRNNLIADFNRDIGSGIMSGIFDKFKGIGLTGAGIGDADG